MKTQKTFRLSKIALVLGVATLGLNANAVYNIYKKDGLTLDINGQVDMQATKKDSSFTLLANARNAYYNPDDGYVYWGAVNPSGTVFSDTDKKTRLNQNQGVSYIDIRGAQVLPQDWRVTGNVGLGYSDDRNLYLSNSSLSLDKKNLGAITLGRQYLHTNYVNRTGTDTPLDIFGTSALRLDYYGIKGLHASTYYSFTGSNDVRVADNALRSGYGASLSYRIPFANNQSLRFGAGYTHSKFEPVTTNIGYFSNANTLNQNPTKTQGVAGSVEYQFNKLLLAVDFGQKKETMSSDVKTPLDNKKTDYLGAKLAFDINPVWQISAGYGIKKMDATLKEGAIPLTNDLRSIFPDDRFSYVGATERHLFNNIDTKEMYVQTDYRLRPNVRLYGRYDTETTTYKLNGTDFSQAKDKNARIGFVFSF